MQTFLKTQYDLNDPNIVSVIDDLPLWSAPFGLKLLDVVKLRKNINVLDIGSGNGFPIIELSQRLGKTCKVYGIDPWKEAVNRIKLKIKMWNIDNVEIIEGKAEEMPFEDKYFDLIVSNNGINNVENDEKALLEIARVSKVGAQMVVTVNLPDTMIELYEVYENILKKNNKNKEIKKLKEHIFSKRKPLSYTKELIKKVGFKIESVFEDSFNLRFSNGSTMLNHFLIKLAFIDSWKAILEEQDVTPIFNTIEKELNKIVQKRGELILTIPWVCIDCRRFEL